MAPEVFSKLLVSYLTDPTWAEVNIKSTLTTELTVNLPDGSQFLVIVVPIKGENNP